MGDRGNIVIEQPASDNDLYFYTHWRGSELPIILKSALIRGKNRWNDDPYLARIIFSEMIKDNVMEETGFGISTYECDNNHENLIVDVLKQEVIWKDQTWSFSEFIEKENPIPGF
jgi:hypothetical protein